jgi:hypothetical protein
MTGIKEVNLFQVTIECTTLATGVIRVSDHNGTDESSDEDLPTHVEAIDVFVTAGDYIEVQQKIMSAVADGGVIAETLDNFVDFERILCITLSASADYSSDSPSPFYLN